ncbi:NADH-quinone oxidoreductase subunit NuoE [Buchnera aphidicola (Formosaphis micheliae)]|uniref:NADH-quinone oxidoreductase subunit NuoE n=1 Tax=Buchnera aphidicola TaxID=9 RepID=UPI0031B8B2E3
MIKVNLLNSNFRLNSLEKNKIKNQIKYYEDSRSVSIEALKIVQKERGWICDEAIFAISKLLGVSVVDIESVATFYNQIFRQPVGKNIIRYCDSIVCFINGYKDIQMLLENILAIKTGETTQDGMFTLLPTCCLGNCDQSPVLMINDDMHFCVTPKLIPNLLDSYK